MDKVKHETAAGQQLVTIDHRLGYQWNGPEPLKIGDRVWLPKTPFMYDDWIGEVTALGSSYDGAHRAILRRAD